jgi:hypothetical protein
LPSVSRTASLAMEWMGLDGVGGLVGAMWREFTRLSWQAGRPGSPQSLGGWEREGARVSACAGSAPRAFSGVARGGHGR